MRISHFNYTALKAHYNILLIGSVVSKSNTPKREISVSEQREPASSREIFHNSNVDRNQSE